MKEKLEQLLHSIKESTFRMRKQLTIADVFQKSEAVAYPHDRLSPVYRLMKANGLKHIPVLEGHRVVGIISRKDIQRLGFGYSYEGRDDVETGIFDMLQADQVMVKYPPVVSPQSTVLEVAELLVTKELAALPVVDAGKNVLGTISISDLLLFLLTGH